MQCARIISSSATCPAVHYFSTLSRKRYDFRKKNIEHKTRVLILSTNFVRKNSHSMKN